MKERAGLKLKIELWAHKNARMERSGIFCAIFLANGKKVGRVDCNRDLFKVEFKSTLETRLAGVDQIIDSLSLQALLADGRTVLMN